MSKGIAPLAPPNPPWHELAAVTAGGGYLAYVYNDDLGPLAVRAVTRVGDNKADPNYETKTYGLFTICGRQARAGIVRRGWQHLFFTTRRDDIRVLTGMYHVRWYAVLDPKGHDYCLAADKLHFVAEPLPLAKVDKVCGTRLNRQFRTCLLIPSNEDCRRLVELLASQPNAVDEYTREVSRLERYNLRHTGYRYVTCSEKEPFSWQCSRAKRILKKARRGPA